MTRFSFALEDQFWVQKAIFYLIEITLATFFLSAGSEDTQVLAVFSIKTFFYSTKPMFFETGVKN